MNLKEMDIPAIEALLDAVNVDISFVDSNDRVTYFNNPKSGRVFPRTKMDIGRKVQNCHPPQSLDKVNAILDGFKSGTRDDAAFWINLQGRFIKIDYFPVRNADGSYLGTVEITQDATELRALQGERRILDE
ncbi:MAG TPA: PAS domain-containing protein [Spirochaetia bacterium]|nr:PAS domain-containing protein [Spirochaetia bacterium]